jgi:hypothetical protein
MHRARFAAACLPLFTALVLLTPGRTFALPSEGMAGKTVLNDVTAGLRKYRQETDPKKRLALLQRLAATGDPRVALALVDAANNHNGDDLDCEAADLLWWYYASPEAAAHRGRVNHDFIPSPPPRKGFRPWWKASEADIRRRASQLPR